MQTDGPGNDGIHRRTRERASIPYYYQIEEFLIKELSRFFEPSLGLGLSREPYGK
ncbi:MAG TPA: hypothetical protein VK469_18395 [Candidatus Kapabacteria bacterium]|nr:hypothetical protein [Candidatus Kapabacteria bacterium]